MSEIIERLSTFGKQEALVVSDRTYLYSDIINSVNLWKNKLAEDGVKSKEVVALYGDFCAEMLFAMFALIINKNIVVPISKEKHEKLDGMLKAAKVDKLYVFEKYSIECVHTNNLETHELLEIIRKENEAGIVIFTSGSTGDGKCALHRFSSIAEKFRGGIQRKALRTLVFLKMDV